MVLRHEYYLQNKAAVHARTRRRRREIRDIVVAGYNGACTCCGERQREFLTLDHVNNDGNIHRKGRSNRSAQDAAYRDAIDRGFPPDYTILCFNCNIARSLFGVCPHRGNI